MLPRGAFAAALRPARWASNVPKKPNIALFVDIENVTATNLLLVRGVLVTLGSPTIQRCYGPRHTPYLQAANTVGMEYVVVEKSSESTDIRLTYDIAQTVLQDADIDAVAIVAGDSDYTELAQWARARGKQVYGFANWNVTNTAWRNGVDRFYEVFDRTDASKSMMLGEDREADWQEPSPYDKAARPWRPTPRKDDHDPLFERFYFEEGSAGGVAAFTADLPDVSRGVHSAAAPQPQPVGPAAVAADAMSTPHSGSTPRADTAQPAGTADATAPRSEPGPRISSGSGLDLRGYTPSQLPLAARPKPAAKPSAADLRAARERERFTLAKHLHTKLAQMDEDAAAGADAVDAAAPAAANAEQPVRKADTAAQDTPPQRKAPPSRRARPTTTAADRKDSFDRLMNMRMPGGP